MVRLLASANAPILTTSAVAVQHHPADASAAVAESRASIGGVPNQMWRLSLRPTVIGHGSFAGATELPRAASRPPSPNASIEHACNDR